MKEVHTKIAVPITMLLRGRCRSPPPSSAIAAIDLKQRWRHPELELDSPRPGSHPPTDKEHHPASPKGANFMFTFLDATGYHLAVGRPSAFLRNQTRVTIQLLTRRRSFGNGLFADKT